MRDLENEDRKKRRRRRRLWCLTLALAGLLWLRSRIEPERATALAAYPYTALESETLKIVSWNTNQSEHDGFSMKLGRLLDEEDPDLVLLQEATAGLEFNDSFWGGHFAASHKSLGGLSTGVATLSPAEPVDPPVGLHSSVSEGFVLAPRSALISAYRLPNDATLLAVNVHGLGTPPTFLLAMQLEEIEARVAKHAGPVILAGDFSTWTQGRLAAVREVAERLGLEELGMFPEGRATVRAGLWTPLLALAGLDSSLPVDRVFYRDLQPLEAHLGEGFESFAHAPLVASFEMP